MKLTREGKTIKHYPVRYDELSVKDIMDCIVDDTKKRLNLEVKLLMHRMDDVSKSLLENHDFKGSSSHLKADGSTDYLCQIGKYKVTGNKYISMYNPNNVSSSHKPEGKQLLAFE